MVFNFGTFSTLLLIFCFHGLVFSLLIFRQGISNNQSSNLWLGLFLLLLVLYISPFMFGYAGWYAYDGYREVLFYLPLQQILYIGPIFLFYLKSQLYPKNKINKAEWLHFVPGSLYLVYSLIVFIGDYIVFEEVTFYADGQDKDFDLWYQIVGFISMFMYFAIGLRLYQHYRKEIFNNLSYAEEITYNWVRIFLIIFVALLLLRGLFFAFNPEWGEFGRKFWYYFSVSIVMYYLAIKGYQQSILTNRLTLHGLSPDHEMQAEETKVRKEPSQSYETTLTNAIIEGMQTKNWYKNPLLTLTDIANELNTTSKSISQAINRGTGLNFNDFCNRYRVESVIAEFNRNKHEHQTLLGIALSCGFNSKSTFNRAFKKHTGVTPKSFLANPEHIGVKS